MGRCKEPCSIEGCHRLAGGGHGWCKTHWLRNSRNGSPHITLKPANGTGYGNVDANGYMRMYRSPWATTKKGTILEHRHVMSEHLGRTLTRHETVHHKNGDRLDNRLENLELWSSHHPPGQRVEDTVFDPCWLAYV